MLLVTQDLVQVTPPVRIYFECMVCLKDYATIPLCCGLLQERLLQVQHHAALAIALNLLQVVIASVIRTTADFRSFASTAPISKAVHVYILMTFTHGYEHART